jgi:hypothetical protein
MKKILFLLVLLPVLAKAQTKTFNDSVTTSLHRVDLAGRHLEKFCEIRSTGIILQGLGYTAIMAGGIVAIAQDNGSATLGLVAVGGALTLTGWIVEQAGYKHVRKASWNLQNAGLTYTIGK